MGRDEKISGSFFKGIRILNKTRRKHAKPSRKSQIEKLEDRFVLSVSLHQGAVPDKVVISQSNSSDDFEITIAPIAFNSTNQGPSDLSKQLTADQRFEITETFGSEQLFHIDPSNSYALSASGRPGLFYSINQLNFGYRSFDIDRNEIEIIHVGKHKNASDTILMADLNPGDTSLVIQNATGWSNEITESAESRSLAWYSYSDSKGNIYPDYTYTRNVASDFKNGVWDVGGIVYEPGSNAYRITLNQPWDGPTIIAGSAVRNATSGPTISNPFPSSTINYDRWESINYQITGTWQSGQRDDLAFRPGTEFIQFTSVYPGTWNSIFFGLEEDFNNVTSQSIPTFGNQQFLIDIDVLSKGDWGALTEFLAGDFNLDGIVDAADYTVWRDLEGTNGIEPFSSADGNGDGNIDHQDYQVWKNNFGMNAALIALPGDFNLDGEVNAADYSTWRDQGSQSKITDYQIWAENFGNRIPVTSLPGDFNLDGKVDIADYTVWRDTIGDEVPDGWGADGSGDGIVDHQDHQVWAKNFGSELSLSIESATATYGNVDIVQTETGQQLRYLSSPWFVGTDYVEYALRDSVTDKTVTFGVIVEVNGSNYERVIAVRDTVESQASNPNNLPPTIRTNGNLIHTTSQNLPLNVESIFGSELFSLFRDPEEDLLVLKLKSGPNHGSLNLNYDGSFNYQPKKDFVGNDVFQVEVFDGKNTVTESIIINVLATADDLILNRLRRVSIGMLNYESVFDRYPLASDESHFDSNGNPYLSWRVHLLPYLGYNNLYQQFNLDEPWNSPNNLPLAELIPNFYQDPTGNDGDITTRIQTFTGPMAPFGFRTLGTDQIGPRSSELSDGTNTALIAESGPDVAVVWTKPQDMVFDINDPKGALGTLESDKINIAALDGSTYSIPASINQEEFSALVTRDRNESVDLATIGRRYLELSGSTTNDSDVTITNQLAEIGLAALRYDDFHGNLPADTLLSDQGDTSSNVRGLSWRVLLLPFLGHANLFSQFNLNEPWDSPTNLPLLDKMPDVFRSANDFSNSNTTRIVRPEGEETGHYNRPGFQDGFELTNYRDGLGNTIFAIEAGSDRAVLWTKPSDPTFDINDPLASLGNIDSDYFSAVFVDSEATDYLPTDISEEDFSALITRNGRETVYPTNIIAREKRELNQFKLVQERIDEFKLLILAELNYESVFGRLAGNRFANDGTPLLSWRVELLRFTEYEYLYYLFEHDEPWDSPHNLSLLPLMPDIFRSIGDPPDSSTTRMIKFTGLDNTPYPSSTDSSLRALDFRSITDGASNTIAFLEGGPEVAEPWTKPVDRPIPNDPFSILGSIGEEFIAVMFAGNVQTFSGQIPSSELRARLTRNGIGGFSSSASSILATTITSNDEAIEKEESYPPTDNESSIDQALLLISRPPTDLISEKDEDSQQLFTHDTEDGAGRSANSKELDYEEVFEDF